MQLRSGDGLVADRLVEIAIPAAHEPEQVERDELLDHHDENRRLNGGRLSEESWREERTL